VQPGLVFLSSRLGLPVVPAGFGFRRAWRMNSWDRFVVPRPGTRATCVTAHPILVPAGAGRGVLDEYRRRIEAELNLLTHAAQRWADTGTAPDLRWGRSSESRSRLAG
jgi:hypothetical protein